MKTAFVALLIVLSALLSGTAVYSWEESRLNAANATIQDLSQKSSEVTSDKPEQNQTILPQIYYMAKAYYSQEDLVALDKNVLQPVIAYYTSKGQTVVSISIDNDNRSSSDKKRFLIDVLMSKNDGSSDPSYFGFTVDKVNGEIPVWAHEDGPSYPD